MCFIVIHLIEAKKKKKQGSLPQHYRQDSHHPSHYSAKPNFVPFVIFYLCSHLQVRVNHFTLKRLNQTPSNSTRLEQTELRIFSHLLRSQLAWQSNVLTNLLMSFRACTCRKAELVFTLGDGSMNTSHPYQWHFPLDEMPHHPGLGFLFTPMA